jgi:pseudouridine-5'-phosphate glycosidase
MEYCSTRTMNFIAVNFFSLLIALASGAQLSQTQLRKPQQEVLMATFSPTQESTQHMTFVVADGGTAGLTIASRLAENPLLNIAVVEADGD